MKARRALEHRLWQILKAEDLVQKKFLLACSGGADSVALARVFAAIRPPEQLMLVSLHHGDGANQAHRQAAVDFVQALAEKLQVPFATFKNPDPQLRSEAQLRQWRRAILEQHGADLGGALIVTAHHRQDVLETRLLRLIRGTGPQGLKAIRQRRGVWLRPFLQTDRRELLAYLEEVGQDWLEDPSNRDPRYFRNWIRHSWLKQLDARQKGAVEALGRSLENLGSLENGAAADDKDSLSGLIIPLDRWWQTPRPEQLGLLAGCLTRLGKKNYTRGQLEEIRRRLDNSRKEHTFELAGCVWNVNAGQIHALSAPG